MRAFVIRRFISIAFGCSKEPVQNSTCAAVEVPGLSGIRDNETSENEVRLSVRTPANYDPTIKHPLLMIYPGAGQRRFVSEHFTGFTLEATAEGVGLLSGSQIHVSSTDAMGLRKESD